MENRDKNRSRFHDGKKTSAGSGMYSEKVANPGASVRPAGVRIKESARKAKPEAEKQAALHPKKKKREKNAVRRKISGRTIAIIVIAAIVVLAVAGGIAWIVIANANRTVHQLPEIRDIEREGDFSAESPIAGALQPESLDSFIAEVGGA